VEQIHFFKSGAKYITKSTLEKWSKNNIKYINIFKKYIEIKPIKNNT
jgi:hypothetical protein